MKTRVLVCFLILAFCWMIGGADSAYARWEDNSDELPGTDSNTTLYIVGGVLAAGVLIFALAKSGGSDDDQENAEDVEAGREEAGYEDEDFDDEDYEDAASQLAEDEMLAQINNGGLAITEKKRSSVDPFLYVKRESLGAGVSFSF